MPKADNRLTVFFLNSNFDLHILGYNIKKFSNEIKCDMIKGNESDVGNIDFELQAKRGNKFLCFTLFLNLKNCSYLCNQVSS